MVFMYYPRYLNGVYVLSKNAVLISRNFDSFEMWEVSFQYSSGVARTQLPNLVSQLEPSEFNQLASQLDCQFSQQKNFMQ